MGRKDEAGRQPGEPRLPAAARIEAALLDDVSVGAIAPGERLDETRLAARFGTSRTPVREALGRLVAAGVATGEGGRGLRVATLTHEELAQMFEAMQEIESVCARLAAQRLTLLGRARLQAAQAACAVAAEAGDIPAYLRANDAFHFEIYAATQNPYVRDLAADFRRRTGPFRAKKFAAPEDIRASARSHEDLLASILGGDAGHAYEGMRAHLAESYLKVLAAN